MTVYPSSRWDTGPQGLVADRVSPDSDVCMSLSYQDLGRVWGG